MNLSIEFFIRCYSKPTGQTSLLPTQEPTSRITPSSAALDDVQALSKPGKDMPANFLL